ENEIKYLVKGEGEFVIKQNIKNQQISENEKLVITLGDIDFNYDELPMFKGKSLKEAISVLNQLKIDFAVEGNGMVVRQYPKAGTSIKKISKVKLVCKSG
ncbi:MAG: PASTA domain-containing protein, partial [Calditrichia bacterium]|nr:PASTA domain-containing protein [Calditrichia bacterium]